MKTKKENPILYSVPMSSKEIIFALLAFRKAHAQEHFMSVRVRLNDALQGMGLDPYGAEFDEATKKYENLFSETM